MTARARSAAPLTAPLAVLLAAVLDAACVVAFAAAGRSSHAEGGGVVGVLGTAWPFLVAGAAGWVVARAWRRPTAVWPTGVVVWAVTWAGGLALRGLAGGGLAPAFVAVAGGVLALGLVGWRTVAMVVSGPARRRTGEPAPRR
ncbi:DUF3054 domain-containing protein [Cellulomonas sp. ATA003]|uniref:DUF3054 domain-containing protein n=1 Tax=Cellulomonas sp. ATA003 TaxID=3073064 RepID=UPI0028736C35|nr:DUF3054 domain-containing protein [Cellulomonas sp. ATA003]WNB86678.1 DUF3054 domain-containing protein [Cellulomonas sp. ATA003]